MSSSHTSRTQVPTTSHIRSSGEPISRPSSAASQSSENRGVDGWEIDPNDGTRRLDHMFSSIIGSTSHGTPGDTTVRMPPIAPQSNPVTRNPLPPQRVTNTNRNTGVFVPPANASTRRAPDQAAEDRSREERDFEVAQFNLKQSKWISQTVSAINNTLKKDLILKSDGSNFSFWTRTLKEIGRTHLTGADFFFSIDEAEWPDALDFYAFTAHKCWSCGGENHYARDCPLKNRSNKGVKQTERGPPIGTIVGTIYGHLPSGFAVSSGRFPNLTNRKHPSTSENQHQARRLADYYRPRYGQPVRNSGPRAIEAAQSQRASVSVQAVEIDGLPDDLDDLNFNSMSLGEDLLPTKEMPLSPAMGP
ncbi:uncharacterized protein VP01_100g21 [Puccinia sorghi]|uniref:CCHC-type domain-containing protein n=1 Tax=Puccinia sorghi TaxID=27349 RepID=A0A0L6VVI8_9BASI|nr:uncharacterized protein VP01_100g21 [Puccinia sorghi]